jgi:hypothetical protein
MRRSQVKESLLRLAVLALVIHALPAAAESVFDCAAEPNHTVAEYGQLFEGPNCIIAPDSDTDIFDFSASEGEKIIIRADSDPGGVCIELTGPTPAEEICGTADGMQIEKTIGETGVHSIVVTGWSPGQEAPYRLVLERLFPLSPSATPVSFGDNIPDDVDAPTDLDLHYFVGAIGDVISLRATTQAGIYRVCMELLDPDGLRTPNGTSVCGGGLWEPAEIDETIQKDGVHAVLVSAQNSFATLSYWLNLECLGGCPAPAACSDGFDNDRDGLIDYPNDPGCKSATWGVENPACQDGIDNDGDGKVDYNGLNACNLVTDPDPQCVAAWDRSESPSPPPCGGGAGLALLPLPVIWLYRRRGRRV